MTPYSTLDSQLYDPALHPVLLPSLPSVVAKHELAVNLSRLATRFEPLVLTAAHVAGNAVPRTRRVRLPGLSLEPKQQSDSGQQGSSVGQDGYACSC